MIAPHAGQIEHLRVTKTPRTRRQARGARPPAGTATRAALRRPGRGRRSRPVSRACGSIRRCRCRSPTEPSPRPRRPSDEQRVFCVGSMLLLGREISLSRSKLPSDEFAETLFDLGVAWNRGFLAGPGIRIHVMLLAMPLHITTGLDKFADKVGLGQRRTAHSNNGHVPVRDVPLISWTVPVNDVASGGRFGSPLTAGLPP